MEQALAAAGDISPYAFTQSHPLAFRRMRHATLSPLFTIKTRLPPIGSHPGPLTPAKKLATCPPPTPKAVLISGAGIAGPSLALLLTNAGHTCTVVEKAPNLRTSGQQIDLAGEALKIVRYMGVEAACWAKRVADDGIKFVDAQDSVLAAFPASSETGSLVKELEIMRPDLAGVVCEATKSKVDYIFNESIAGIKQDEQGVTATFANGTRERTFDLLICADGLRSHTRTLVFPATNTKIVTFNQYAAYFSIPWAASDGTWSRWYNVPGGRCVSTRPNITNNTTSAYLCQVTPDAGKVATLAPEAQKAEIKARFRDAGWESERILAFWDGEEGERFYCQEVAQSKSERFVNGRVALLGDAGYCPSPISGQGSSIAMIGAYILAGCIATHEDAEEALQEYEKLVRPFADAAQNLPPGVPGIVNPQSAMGITVLNQALKVGGFVFNSGLAGLVSRVVSPVTSLLGGKALVLPEFAVIHVEGSQ